ncbi:hypothetical protein [Methylobacter sp. S3L5C]|uniref:hypothetical protein n=1 Tax=Methylobacter sp. S3L5C TaxID=2839024 RepID=UPI001FAD4D05|nr:hypothetical protein [Methylobacter sp. S3L5C]UOA08607.1 hypothetical protein KKZ03_20850 [Methylobacter sp. S3L5C]
MTDVKSIKRIKTALQPEDWIVGQEDGAGLGDQFRFQAKNGVEVGGNGGNKIIFTGDSITQNNYLSDSSASLLDSIALDSRGYAWIGNAYAGSAMDIVGIYGHGGR